MRPGMLLMAKIACSRKRVSPTLLWGYWCYVSPMCCAIGRCLMSSTLVPARSEVGGSCACGACGGPAGFVWVIGVLRMEAKETTLAFIWFISGVPNAVRDRIDVSCRFFVRVRYLGRHGGL